MSAGRLPRTFQRPSGLLIPRVVDQLSYLYLDYTRIQQDRTGIQASMDTAEGTMTAYLPTAALASVMLGPGTSITRDAVITLARHGTSVVFVGSAGVRCYSTINGPSSTELLLEMARIVSEPELRMKAARHMYQKRFAGELPDTLTLAALRGLEGARMRAIYQSHAKRVHIKFRREYTPGDLSASDPVNAALTAGNTALYGIVNAVLASLGIHSGLGIVHNGHSQALTFDIADLYKAQTTIPLAFSLTQSADPDGDVRKLLRKKLTLLRLIPTIVHDVYELLGRAESRSPTADPSMDDVDVVNLWDEATTTPSGRNYSPVDD